MPFRHKILRIWIMNKKITHNFVVEIYALFPFVWTRGQNPQTFPLLECMPPEDKFVSPENPIFVNIFAHESLLILTFFLNDHV